MKPPSAPPAQPSPSQPDSQSTPPQAPTVPASEPPQTAPELADPQTSADQPHAPQTSTELAPAPQPAADDIPAPEDPPEPASAPPYLAIPFSQESEVIQAPESEPQSPAVDGSGVLPATATPSVPELAAPLIESSPPESFPDPPSQDPPFPAVLAAAPNADESLAQDPQSTETPIPAIASGTPQILPASTTPLQEPILPTADFPSNAPFHEPPHSAPNSEAPHTPGVADDDDDWEARARAAAMRGNAPAPGGEYEIIKMERPADSSLGQVLLSLVHTKPGKIVNAWVERGSLNQRIMSPLVLAIAP